MNWRRVGRITVVCAGILLALVIAALIVVQTGWFRNYVRGRIVSSIDRATSGKAQIQTFAFDPWRLRATITGFVLHSDEPAGAAPFLRIARAVIEFHLFPAIDELYEISYAGVDGPQINVIVRDDGSTNVPAPKVKRASNETLQNIVDLAIRRFELTNGLATIDSRKQPLNIRGNNLTARLAYDTRNDSYQGNLALQPVYVAFRRQTPVNIAIALPLLVGPNRIAIDGGSISSGASRVAFNISLDDLKNPTISGHIGGHIGLADVRDFLGNTALANSRGLPSSIAIDASATGSSDRIDVTALHLSAGQTDLAGSGLLKSPGGSGALAFHAKIALTEIGKALSLATKPEGRVLVNGSASMDAANRYLLAGNIDAQNVSFQKPRQTRIGGINLVSMFRVDPQAFDLNDVRLTAFGGEFQGSAALAGFRNFTVNGDLRHLDLENALSAVGRKLPYSGFVSGPIAAQGDINVPGVKSLSANASLAITPGPSGIPVSGRVNAAYSGATDRIVLSNSYIQSKQTRLNLSGALDPDLKISLTTRNLRDLLAATPFKGPEPIALDGGELTFQGTMTGAFTNPQIRGHVTANRFTVEGRQFEALSADLAARSSGVSISNASLQRGAMRLSIDASLGLRRWRAEPYERLAVTGSIRDGDLADLAVMAGQPAADFSGALTASVDISGTLGNPLGMAKLDAANGTIEGEPFTQLGAQVNVAGRQISVPVAFVQSAAGRLDLTAQYRHSQRAFTTGQLQIRLRSTPLNLAEIPQVRSAQPALSGMLQLDLNVNGDVGNPGGPAFLLRGVNGDVTGRALQFRGAEYGTLSAAARTTGQLVTYTAAISPPGSALNVNGNTTLTQNYPISANAQLTNFPLTKLLALAGRENIPARGTLAGTAHFDGTLRNPQATVDLTLTHAGIYGQPIDRGDIRASWLDRSVVLSRFDLASGAATVRIAGRYDHPAGDLMRGNAQFDVSSSGVNFSNIAALQQLRPGLGGTIQLTAKGAVQVRQAGPGILLTSLNAGLDAKNITAQGTNLGNLALTANTSGASQLSFALNSDLGGASIKGQGNATLTGDYPVRAQLSFTNVFYNRWRPLFAAADVTAGTTLGARPAFDAATDGEISISGPVLDADKLQGSLRLTKLIFTTTPLPGAGKPVAIANQGPVVANLDRGVIQISSAHLTGPDTSIAASGTTSLSGKALNLMLNARTNLSILPDFDPQIYSSGMVRIDAAVLGSVAAPAVTGQLTLTNAAFNYAGITNGISNANGVIAFNGKTAIIRNLTAESGGGKVSFTGFAGYTNVLRFGIEASAKGVRVRPQAGVSVTIATELRLSGAEQNSVVAGSVSINQFSYNPSSDIGSILSRATPPVGAPVSSSLLLSGMRLEIAVRSATGVAVQASLAQNLQADVDLRIRGTAAQPAVLGRITVNEGKLVFFGVSYTVSNGAISFYNPVTIQPVLDISLETTAQGVHVTLKVTGPIDNMKLSYTSDPPLQFQEIISLLAVGQTPTSDPTLLAMQPQTPQQSYEQMGESAILTEGLANPVSSRLQRVFGVTQLQIAPAFQAGVTQLPTARVTVQQQISSNVVFTYTSALDDPNGLIVKLEWAFSAQYSAIATRDENGIFSLNFYYRRQFH